jgi:hypothetical protein
MFVAFLEGLMVPPIDIKLSVCISDSIPFKSWGLKRPHNYHIPENYFQLLIDILY